jgi:hypothetical protein
MSRNSAPENETKRQKFERLADARVKKALHDIRLIGQCANKALYEYDVKDVDIIVSSITDALNEYVKAPFAGKKNATNLGNMFVRTHKPENVVQLNGKD